MSSTAAGRMYQGNEYNGFLYDAKSRIELYNHALLEKPINDKEFARLPLLGYFKVRPKSYYLYRVSEGLGDFKCCKKNSVYEQAFYLL